jgi:hypothetical protein
VKGAHTVFLIFRRKYLIGPSPIFFEHEAFPNIENWILFWPGLLDGSSSLRLPCIADDCTHSRRLAHAARKAQAPWTCLFDAPWTTIPESVETTWWRSEGTFIFANSFYICSHFFFVCISFLLWSSVDHSQYSSLLTWVFSKSLNWSKS